MRPCPGQCVVQIRKSDHVLWRGCGRNFGDTQSLTHKDNQIPLGIMFLIGGGRTGRVAHEDGNRCKYGKGASWRVPPGHAASVINAICAHPRK